MRAASSTPACTVRRVIAALALTLGATVSGTPAVEAGDRVPAEPIGTVEAEWKAIEKPTIADYRRFIARFRAIEGGEARAKDLAVTLLKQGDANDRSAHDVLGHKEFAFEVPEEISYRRYPFVRIVEEAREKRWFDDLGPYAEALEAYVKCLGHAKRLSEDPAYMALDVARRGIDRDEALHSYNYDAVFASPYLICYTTKERIDEAAMWDMTRAARARAWAELDARRLSYKRVLAEKALIYAQVYAEFLKRYAATCDLRPLMDEFGGRPDYPPGKRSYREGCPLIVWIFSDREAWDDFHTPANHGRLEPSVIGYHEPGTGVVYAYDHAPDDRETVFVNTRVATLQLLHWFARQRNEWAPVRPRTAWFTVGFPDWFGSVALSTDRSLTFLGLAAQRERFTMLRGWNDQLAEKQRPLPVFPLRDLAAFEQISDAAAWGARNFRINPVFAGDLFREQSHALVLFLNEAADGKYRPAFEQFLKDMLDTPREPTNYGTERFRKAFGLETNDDWQRLDAEFQTFYADLAKHRDSVATIPTPALADWPGYVAPDLEAPTGPPVGK